MKVLEVIAGKPAGVQVVESNGAFAAVFEAPCTKKQFDAWIERLKETNDLAFLTPMGEDGASFASQFALTKMRNEAHELAAGMGCPEFARVVLMDEAQLAAEEIQQTFKANDREIMLGVVLGFKLGGMGPKAQVEALRDGRAMGVVEATEGKDRITQQMLSEFASELEAYYEQRKETR